MKSRMKRLKGAGILMAAVVAAGSLQIPAMAQVEAAENNPVVETTITEADSFGASSSQGAQLNFSNIGATYIAWLWFKYGRSEDRVYPIYL